MHKFLPVVLLMSLVLVVTSESEEAKRARSCSMRAGGSKATQCKSNTSFIKRIYDAYRRDGVDTETGAERGWANLEAERRANEAATAEEKLRLLNELLDELELYNDKK